MSYIDGLASGLNTTEIIQGLMQVEAIPKTLLENKVKTVQAGLDGYASIRTKISAVRTASEAIGSALDWNPLTATSSNTDAVTASATSGAPAGAMAFTVVNLATAMQRSSADTFTGYGADLGGRTIAIAKGGYTLQSTATTLGDLLDEINADTALGVRASTIQVTPGEHRIVLTSKETGAANAFTAVGTGWGNGFSVTANAEDAVLDVGGITVTRPTNTINDLVDGTTITLKAETTSPVTVNVARDVDAITEKVKALVDAVNSALAEMKLRTGYDAETNQRASLTGDATVRQLSQSLTQAFTAPVYASSLSSVGLAGVELQRDGTIAFDETKFKAAYDKDPAAVERLFTDGASSDSPDLTYTYASWRAQPGTYAVEVTNTAGVYTATIDGETAEVTVNGDGTLKVAMDTLHNRLGGLSVTVSGVLPADGATQTIGSITYDPGAGQRLSTMSNRALDPVDGLLTSAEDARKRRIDDIEKQVDAWELRLEKRELGLRRQYTAMETMLSQLSNQGQWMSSQISGLQASNQA
ncbi:MAG: flagellar filament capping protein FliD [Acidimicrobiia bacterium]|nr:flagellar filament capping protein FliD [Acidimicrobiia bacterium]